jgi:hypothetical protein
MSNVFINKDCFKVWRKSNYPQTSGDIRVILSLYSPHFIDGAESDNNGYYTAGIAFGMFDDINGNRNLILFSLFPPSLLDPHELIIHSQNLCIDYFNNSKKKAYDGWCPDLAVIPSEEKIRNIIIRQIEKKNGEVPIRRFYYENYGGTLENMVKRAIHYISMGRVWVAARPEDFEELRNIDERFLDIISGYPSDESKATVWCLAQALLYLESYGVFTPETDQNQNQNKNNHGFYGPDTEQ